MSFYTEVYDLVRQIPEGKVTTYGIIASRLGHPRASRVVGGALHKNPAYGDIPCHRVVNRKGQLAPCFAFGGASVQRALLETEGVPFRPDGTVDLKKCLW